MDVINIVASKNRKVVITIQISGIIKFFKSVLVAFIFSDKSKSNQHRSI